MPATAKPVRKPPAQAKYPHGLSAEQLRTMHRQMLLARRVEERVGQLYQMRKIQGFCHLYIGQEAVAVGSLAATRPQDYIFQTYRDHVHAILRGIPVKVMLAELYGKVTGCSRGKGGSMHMYNAESRMMGGNGIVGGHVPLAIGAAWKSMYRGLDEVTLCYMGEAAVNQGTFHESLNMASLWKLPVVFIAENNLYGMGTAVGRASAEPDLYKRTEGAYRIRGVRADGMDALDMYKVTADAVADARAGRPVFIEAVTYRYRGHSMSDPALTYRSKDEVGQWRTKDCIERMQLQFPDLIPADHVQKCEDDIAAEIEDAVKFAEESAPPEASELYTDIYANWPGYPTWQR